MNKKNLFFLLIIVFSTFIFFSGNSKKDDVRVQSNFDISSTTINYFDSNKADKTEFKIIEDNAPFSIVDYSPINELPAHISHPTIYVLFSQPVVPISKLGGPITTSNIIKIEPEIKGVYRWYGTKLYAFEPKEAFLDQREYKVAVNESVRSLGGKSLTGVKSFNFRTEPLKINNFYPTGKDVSFDNAKNMIAVFNHQVNLDVIKDYIKITSNNKDFSFVLTRPEMKKNMKKEDVEKTVKIVVQGNFESNSHVEFVLLKGARSEKDFIGTQEEYNYSFSTLNPFTYKEFNFDTYYYPNSDKPTTNPVFILFSHPINEKTFKNNIDFSLKTGKENALIEIWGAAAKISNLPVTFNTKYKIFLKKNIEDIYGRKLDEDITLEVEVPSAARGYYFPNSGFKMLEAQFPPKLVFEYQNVYDGVWKIDKISDPFKEFSDNELVPYDFSKLKENVRHFEVLDLSPYLNKEGKGFVGVSWNFSRKTIPERIDYYTFQAFISKIKDSNIRSRIEGSFYTNNQKKYYWVEDEFRWDYKKLKELEVLMEKAGFKLERSSYNKTDLMLQVTDLGITTRYSYNKVLVWVNYLSSGKPVDRANVILKDQGGNNKIEGKTDSSGLAVIKLKEGDYVNYFYNDKNNYYAPRIYVEKGNDKVDFIPNESHNAYHFGVYNSESPVHSEAPHSYTFMFTDRGVYRPGETLTFRGIDRALKLGEYYVYEGSYRINIINSYEDGNKPIITLDGKTTNSGGFYGSVKLPDSLEPGWYTIQYIRGMHAQNIGFQVANFRRLNFQVKVNKPKIESYFTGDNLTFTVNASYLSGGSLSQAKCEYYWTKAIIDFTPAGEQWNSYMFGATDYEGTNTINEGKGALNQLGELVVKQGTDTDNQKGVTYNYTLYAMIEDIDRQVIQGVQSAIVHPASFYIGAKFTSSNSYFVKKGEKVEIESVFVRPNGDVYNVKEPVNVNAKLYRIDWKIAQQQGVYDRVNTRYERIEELESEFDAAIKDNVNKLNFTTEKSGQYKVVLECKDEKNRTALTEFYFYSTGSDWVFWGSEGANDLTLFPDKQIYKTGDEARILIQSPLPQGNYLVTIEREGIFEERIVKLTGSANFIEIPIKEKYLPIIYVAVSSYSIRSEAPTNTYTKPDLGKPKGYFGMVPIRVSTVDKEIEIEIKNNKSSYLPGEEAEVLIKATKNGKPVSDAEITFLAADRGVLDLINYHIPDPVSFFYDPEKFYLCVIGADSRSLLIDPVTYEVKDLQGGSGDEEDKMKTRKDFSPTAIFEPFLKTNKKGEVTVKFKLPDNLTTYRATAIGVNNNLFGIKENEILVQNPINVKTALPRKLRVRDTSFAGVIATNLTGKEQEIMISISTDILTVEGDKTKKIKIPAESSREIPFKIAALKEGEANISFIIKSSVINEKLEVKLPVEAPIIKETFTTIGKIDPKANSKNFIQEGLIIPKNITDNFGELKITVDDTKLTTLAGSLRYLYNYPYGCLEQRSSKIFPLVVFKDKVKGFINTINVKSVVENELKYWAKFQNSDGGFPFWLEGGQVSGYFISIKVAKLLYFASKNGFIIPSSINTEKLLSYIQTKRKSYDYEDLYSLYVLSLWGKNVYIKADEFYKKKEKLNSSELSFLTLTFLNLNKKDQAKDCFNRLKNFIKVGTQSIDLSDNTRSYYFNSDVNKLALLLMSYNKLDSDSEIATRIVSTLTQKQKNGYWGNTYSTEWAIQAFYEVFEKDQLDESNYKAIVDIGGTNVITHEFKRKKGILKVITDLFTEEKQESYSINLPFNGNVLSRLQRDKMYPINLKMDGKGVMYYTLTYTYALPFEIVLPRDEGFSIYTEIRDLDDNALQNQAELKLGETYRMRIVVSTSKNRNYAILRVPVPSGSEILDASFVTTAAYQNKDKKNKNNQDNYDYWEGGWNEPMQKIYDNEVQYIFDYFKKGKEEMEFLFRVTNPGIYPTPPVTIECMYEEEVFGRTGGALFLLKP